MKWFVYLLSLAVCALWLPVVPVAVHSASTSQTIKFSPSAVSVVVVSSPTLSVAAVSTPVCGSHADKVGDWLNQTPCDDLLLSVVGANSDAFQLVVVDTPLVASLAVQYPQATLGPVGVRPAPTSPPVVAESPYLAASAVPRQVEHLSTGEFSALRVQFVAFAGERLVTVFLRC